jgi:glycosyltransferase involved in cell wall biosynthesis
MSVPRITALIDTYNQGRFIDEAIESVLAQDFPASEMEILVVDDGSTDDTRARVEKYGEPCTANKRIRWRLRRFLAALPTASGSDHPCFTH